MQFDEYEELEYVHPVCLPDSLCIIFSFLFDPEGTEDNSFSDILAICLVSLRGFRGLLRRFPQLAMEIRLQFKNSQTAFCGVGNITLKDLQEMFRRLQHPLTDIHIKTGEYYYYELRINNSKLNYVNVEDPEYVETRVQVRSERISGCEFLIVQNQKKKYSSKSLITGKSNVISRVLKKFSCGNVCIKLHGTFMDWIQCEEKVDSYKYYDYYRNS